MALDQPSIFVSYAHEDADLAHGFARAMEAEGARVWLDQGELLIGDSLIERISEAIAEFDFVAALVSRASVESNWCRKEIALAMSKQLSRGARRVTVLPLRVGDTDMPASLRDVKWLDLNPADVAQCAAQVVADAARHLRLASSPAPQPRASARFSATAASVDDPVRIVGVDTAQIGRPRNDGSRGSALYTVPLLLNHVPHPLWSQSFPEAWNSPPAWTTMHRPGIGSVRGDRIVLDGTTIEELERYHLTTLKLVVQQLNELLQKHLDAEQIRLAAEAKAAFDHEQNVQGIAARLRFDK